MNNDNLKPRETNLPPKDEFCVWSELGKDVLEYDINEEYILPDYFPDVRKILAVKTYIEGEEEFIRDGAYEFGGKAVFEVLFLGDNGQISCVSKEFPYTDTLTLEGIFEDSIVIKETAVKGKSVRALSSRKLGFKGKVASEVKVYNKLCVSPRLQGGSGIEDEFTLERRLSSVETINYINHKEADIRISEDVEFRGRLPISELVFYDMEVFALDCRYSDGKCFLKGNTRVKCLVACKDGEDGVTYETVEKSIPIDHTFEIRLPEGKYDCFCTLNTIASECSVANDSYGESRIIEADLLCYANICFMSNGKTAFTDDVFSTAYEYINTYETVNTERLVKNSYGNFSISGKGDIPLSEGSTLEKVVYCTADADMSLSGVVNGKAVFNGECFVKAVLQTSGGDYTSADITLPVKYESTAECVDGYECRCKCNVIDTRVSVDGNSLNVNGEIALCFTLVEMVEANTVSKTEIDKNSPLPTEKERVMILYYPEEGETLWSVAKKYGVSRALLEKENNRQLTEGLPRVLVIPSKSK